MVPIHLRLQNPHSQEWLCYPNLPRIDFPRNLRARDLQTVVASGTAFNRILNPM